jgi:hypothetical protein
MTKTNDNDLKEKFLPQETNPYELDPINLA